MSIYTAWNLGFRYMNYNSPLTFEHLERAKNTNQLVWFCTTYLVTACVFILLAAANNFLRLGILDGTAASVG